MLMLDKEQVETLLKNQDSTEQTKDTSRQDSTSAYVANTISQGLPDAGYLAGGDKTGMAFPDSISPGPDVLNASATGNPAEGEFPWEMIGLGLDEPLPPQDVMDDL
jgi:hypothetical protein